MRAAQLLMEAHLLWPRAALHILEAQLALVEARQAARIMEVAARLVLLLPVALVVPLQQPLLLAQTASTTLVALAAVAAATMVVAAAPVVPLPTQAIEALLEVLEVLDMVVLEEDVQHIRLLRRNIMVAAAVPALVAQVMPAVLSKMPHHIMVM